MNDHCKHIAVIDTHIEFTGFSFKLADDNIKLYVTEACEPLKTSKIRSEAFQFDSELNNMEFLETMFKIYPNGGYNFEKV